jgi:ketose-bisphosphate aldolase
VTIAPRRNETAGMDDTAMLIRDAGKAGLAVPGFNIPYLPMMEPVVRALRDSDAAGLIMVARLEWVKFGAGSLRAIRDEYRRVGDRRHTRLHLDHVPVIDEDGVSVDFPPVFKEAITAGYGSVMIDGSRLPLEDNIRAVQQVVALAGPAGVPVEAELGAVLGHEDGPLPSYEELFASGRGFTAVDDALRFVRESGCDWLSVAVGNIHGAIAAGRKDEKKVTARLNLERLEQLNQALGIPLVLHGGSGIQQDNVRAGMQRGIAKINVGTEIRQPYEVALRESGDVARAQLAVYERTKWVLSEFLGVAGRRADLAA